MMGMTAVENDGLENGNRMQQRKMERSNLDKCITFRYDGGKRFNEKIEER